jgi:hypothetical protein
MSSIGLFKTLGGGGTGKAPGKSSTRPPAPAEALKAFQGQAKDSGLGPGMAWPGTNKDVVSPEKAGLSQAKGDGLSPGQDDNVAQTRSVKSPELANTGEAKGAGPKTPPGQKQDDSGQLRGQ